MTENAPKHAAWIGLVMIAFGFVGIIAQGVVDVLERAFHLQPNVFFGFWILLGFAIWYPVGARNSFTIVVDSLKAILTSWRSQPPPPPPMDGGVS